ncbi:response regulator transcription factor [Bacillus cereus group sp. BfR-BA-01538]|uniref:response regulator transcription factor n=1 Tax=Bacillus cereus group sp. BfR-BA-01538 TaxID=2920373 RepID=UPI001F5AB848
MKRILIVEDEEILRETVSHYFVYEGYEVLSAEDGQIALDLFNAHHFDLVILDIMLPKVDGWSVCRRIRKLSSVPVILLTARSDEEDTLLGFELGADDYVTKPFKPAILLARANRLLKDSLQLVEKRDVISQGGIDIDKLARSISIEGQKINLTHTEFEILLYLMEHKGQALTRESLITHIWGYDYDGDDSTLTAHVRNLRHKLDEKAKYITTVIRVGYKFEVED